MDKVHEAGMTLIEVLVLLAIIAIAAGISVLAIGGGGGVAGRAEAARLASRLQLAVDRAMIEDGDVALAPARDGYGFVVWNAERGTWQPSAVDGLGARYRLPAGMALTIDDPRPIVPLGMTSGGRGFTLTLSSNGRSYTIDFDGATARLRPDRAPSPPAAMAVAAAAAA